MPLFFLLAAVVFLGGFATAKAVANVLEPKKNRSLDMLEPGFRARFEAFKNAAAAQGKPLIVAETWRNDIRQAWLFGSSRPGDPKAVYKGVDYGRPGPWLTDRTPAATPSNHQKVTADGKPAAQAVDTIPGDPKVKADSPEAVEYLRSLEPLAKVYGLKNLRNDWGHWENA